MNSQAPAEHGGAGASSLAGCLIAEEPAWGWAGIATTLEASGLASAPLLLGGSEKLKKEYLVGLTEAPLLASFCLTEPSAGSDVSGMRTSAVRKGDKWVINGSKVFITNGEYANWYTVYAKTDREAGHRGISAFVLPRDAGVIVDKHEDKMGLRASNTAAITFEECEIPADHLLGEEKHGFRLAMMTLDRTRRGVASLATGIARAALEFAIDYSKERVQFGRADPDARGDPVHDRRHGHRGRGGAPADLEVGGAARPGQAQHLCLLPRQALRRRPGDEGRYRRGAGVRRLRFHQGVSGRETDA
jgi:acyl-CoA dehydrogenase